MASVVHDTWRKLTATKRWWRSGACYLNKMNEYFKQTSIPQSGSMWIVKGKKKKNLKWNWSKEKEETLENRKLYYRFIFYKLYHKLMLKFNEILYDEILLLFSLYNRFISLPACPTTYFFSHNNDIPL